MRLQEILDWLAEFAPLALAADWDNVGLLLGDPEQECRRVVICLTVTPETVAEAVRQNADLVVSHHPILFRPVQRLAATTAEGKLLRPLLAAGVAVYSPHTAFDNCQGGINDELAELLELREVKPLQPQSSEAAAKLVVFVPEADLAKVSDALFASGAGRIGHYEQCSFRLRGVGTFFGQEASQPTVGRKGRREEVEELRLEVVVPLRQLDAAVAALRRAHSYEEPAFDIYPLRAVAASGGVGRIGRLPSPLPLREFASSVCSRLGLSSLQWVGPAERPIQSVAVVCGAGGSLLPQAQAAGADVFLTGEMRFHDLLAAQAQGMAVILPGHHATERLGVERLAARLAGRFPTLDVWAARQERDPLQTVVVGG